MLLPLVALAVPITMAPTTFYIGTYTSNDGSKGIYRSSIDEQGKLTAPELVAETANPSYLAMHPRLPVLYAVNEGSGGEVAAFGIGPENLSLLGRVTFNGGGPCHLSVDPSGKALLLAAYGGGTVTSIALKSDGSLGQVLSSFKNEGKGPNSGRQEAPHLHFVEASLDGKHVYACDLGTDEVLHFRLDAGKLELATPRSAKVSPGGGPRHFAQHPNGKFLYVNSELTGMVTVFERDSQTGSLTSRQELSSLPEGDRTSRRGSAGIFLHPSGKWLYVSNRAGHDSIAVYRVGGDGLLTQVQVALTGVREPRGFHPSPCGKWMVVGGQNSNELATLPIDPVTGMIGEVAHRIAISKPVSVLFPR